jgi:hypothetical protein
MPSKGPTAVSGIPATGLRTAGGWSAGSTVLAGCYPRSVMENYVLLEYYYSQADGKLS